MKESRSLWGQVTHAMFWNSVLFPLKAIVGFGSSVVMLNVLNPQAVGLLKLLTATAGTIGLYADLGIERSLPKFIPEVERRWGWGGVRRLLRLVVSLKLGLLTALVAALNVLADPFLAYVGRDIHDPVVAAQFAQYGRYFVLALSAMLVLGAVYDVFMQVLITYFRQKSWNLITIGVSIVQPLLIAGFLMLGWGVGGVLLAMAATPALAVVLAIWRSRKVTAIDQPGAGTEVGRPIRKRFVSYSLMQYMMNATVYFQSPPFAVLVLATGKGLTEVAILGVAYDFVNQVMMLLWAPLSGIQTPLFGRIFARGSQQELQSAYQTLTKFLAALLVPSAFGLAILSFLLVPAMFPKYTAAVPAVVALTFLMFLETTIGIPYGVLTVYEKYRPIVISRVIAMMSLPLLVLSAYAGGRAVFYAAVSLGVARVAGRSYALWAAQKELSLAFPFAFVARVALSSVALSVVLAPITRFLAVSWEVGSLGTQTRLLMVGACVALACVGVCVFIVAFKALGGLDASDKDSLSRLNVPLTRLVVTWL